MRQAVLRKFEPQMRAIYECYAGVDTAVGAIDKMSTMNIKEMNELVSDCGFYESGGYSAKDMITAFVRVNIDDELYVQEDQNNTPTELVFDEFTEMIARLWNGLVWSGLRFIQQQQSDAALALQNWFVDVFLKKAMECVNKRMRAMRRRGSVVSAPAVS